MKEGNFDKQWTNLTLSTTGDKHFKIEVLVNKKQKVFDIITISKNQIEILLRKEDLDIFSEGMNFEETALYIGNDLETSLNLTLHKIKKKDDKNDLSIAFFSPNDEKSSTLLWELLYNYKLYKTSNKDITKIDNLSLPKIPGRGIYTEEARQERLNFIRQESNAKLELVEKTSFNAEKLTGNIESFIGSIEIPVGLAGPLLINGKNASGVFYAPIATSEGALVASISRGAVAISKSGGATSYTIRQRMLRVPMFSMDKMESAILFASWLLDHFDEIKEQTKKYSNFASLKELEPVVVGKDVHVNFVYETGDAAGQNMTTTCTWNTCKWIFEQTQHMKTLQVKKFLIDASLSNDKRVTHRSFILGRGIRVMSEVFIPEEVLTSVLKVTARQLASSYLHGVSGCIEASMVGINVNIANVIAGIFTATGQDIASVHESSIGHFHIEEAGNGIYASMMLPSLIVGTVGGGTNLPHQKECLEIIGCVGAGNSHKLAEIINSFCLALDLSTLSAIASGQFASAHESLGRNRPVDTLKKAELNEVFLGKIMSDTLEDENIEIINLDAVKSDDLGSSIITKLTSNKVNKLLGFFCYDITYKSKSDKSKTLKTILKIKPTDSEVKLMQHSLALICDPRLASEIKRHRDEIGIDKCHKKEIEIFKQKDPRFTKHIPEIYGLYQNDKREAYLILMERLENMVLMDSVNDISGWDRKHIESAIDGISEIHSIWYGKEKELEQLDWIGSYPTKESMMELSRLWELLAVNAHNEFPQLVDDKYLEIIHYAIYGLLGWWGALSKMPKTLIHNDFNPRNLAFRKDKKGLSLCVYDWELATIHVPQHDVAELLVFTLTEECTEEEVRHYVEYHRKMMEKFTETSIDPQQWWDGFKCSIGDLLINRMSMYLMAHTVRDYEFMDRVYSTLKRMVEIINGAPFSDNVTFYKLNKADIK